MADLKTKIEITADGKSAQAEFDKTTEAVNDTAKATDKAGFSFKSFALSAASVVTSLISVSINLARLAANYLGLTVEIETTNKKLKIFDFFVQNARKEITLSLGFLNKFADYLRKIEFPINQIIEFIDLAGDFRVKIGIGQGEKTIFDHTADGLKKAAVAAKEFQLDDFKSQVKDAVASLLLFSAQAATTFASLKKGVEREASFSAASRTITGTKAELAALKTQIDDVSATKLAVDTTELYAVAGIAGAMGKELKDIPPFIQLVSEAAIAFNIPADSVAEKLATIQTQLALTDEGVISLADQVNALADSMPGKVNEIDVFEVLSTGVASAGKSFGLLKGETIALAGSLLSLGEAPETARTAIVSLLTKLQTANVGTKDFKDALAQMGTSANKLKEDIRTKPMPTLVAFLKQLKGFDEFKKKELLVGIMGTGGDMNAVTKLTASVDLLEKSLGTATDATQYSGSVHKAYQQQIATSAAKIMLLKNALENFTERLTSTFLPAINLVVDGITRMVNALSTFSQDHPFFKTVAAVGVTILSLAGILRFFSFAWGKLIPIISSNLAKVGLSLASFTLSLTGVGAVIAAFSPGLVLLARNIILAAKAGQYLNILKLALGFLFGGTIGVAIGSLSLLFLGIANLLPMTVKWGETTATVGRVISAAFDLIIEKIKPTADAIADLTLTVGKYTLGIGAAAVATGLLTLAIQTGLASALISVIPLIAGMGAAWVLALSPFTLVVAGLVAIGAAFELLTYKINGNFISISDVAKTFTNGLVAIFSLIGISVAALVQAVAAEFQTFEDILNGNSIAKAWENRAKRLEVIGKEYQDAAKKAFQTDYVGDFSKELEVKISTKANLAAPDKRAADTGKTPTEVDQAAIDTAKKQADLIAQIEKETREKRLADIRANEAENIRLAENSGKTQKQINDDIFKIKTESAKEYSTELKNQLDEQLKLYRTFVFDTKTLTKEELQAKKATLKEIQTAYKTNIDSLNALEKEHRDKVISLDKEIRDVKKQGRDGLREIERAGMTDAQVSEDKKLEIKQKSQQFRELMDKKEYEQAAELAKELNGLTKEQALAAAASVKAGGDKRDLTIAEYDYQQSLTMTEGALKNVRAEEQKKADSVAFQAEMQRQAYESVGKQIEALNTTLTTGAKLDVIIDSTQIDDLKTKIENEIPKEKIINIKWSSDKEFTQIPIPQPKGYATGGFVGGTGTGDTIPAMLTPNEYVLTVPEAKMLKGMGFFNWLKSPKQKFSSGGFIKPSSFSSPSLSSGGKSSSGETFNLNLNLGNQTVAATVDKQNFDILKSLSTALEKQSRVQR